MRRSQSGSARTRTARGSQLTWPDTVKQLTALSPEA